MKIKDVLEHEIVSKDRLKSKILQRACNYFGKGLVVDGILGLNTFTAINSLDADKLLREIRFNHAKFYLDLIEEKPTLAKFKNGWLRRACS